jgi:PPK2 family polyphosphate:nucleotide phosphotransferase
MAKTDNSTRYRVKPGSKVELKQHDPGYDNGYTKGSPEVEEKLARDLDRICEWQEKLYAESKQALLIVLQGMDASGKDGTISHVMRGLNPQGCAVASFKVPTPQELAHDFLWRIHQKTPARGQIAVFNRSHYEDVLAVRVRKLVPQAVWKARYDQINDFESMLTQNGTRIVKLFLHISREEQKKRLQKRLEDPKKHWKYSPVDDQDSRLWNRYVTAYEEALSRCSMEAAPWYVIPADRKWYRNLAVAEIVEQTLAEMKPQWPQRPEAPAEGGEHV